MTTLLIAKSTGASVVKTGSSPRSAKRIVPVEIAVAPKVKAQYDSVNGCRIHGISRSTISACTIA